MAQSTQRPWVRKYIVGDLSWRRWLRSVVVIYLCMAAYAWFISDRVIFQPPTPGYAANDASLHIPTQRGAELAAIYNRIPGAPFTVLYCHANAVDLAGCAWRMQDYQDLGLSVLCFDYRGYGHSPGRATAANACDDAEAAYRYMVDQLKIPPDQIVIHGRSVGGGPALYVASRNPVAGVILESTFVSAFRVLTRIPLFPFDKLRNLSRIDRIDCPLLILHGENDRTIAPWHGRALFDRAREPKTYCALPDASHNDISPADGQRLWQAIADFVISLAAGPDASTTP